MRYRRALVLGLHPSSRGFGWVLFEGHRSLLDWGVVDVRAENAAALPRIEALLEKHHPSVLAIERHDGASIRRRQRIQRLYRAIVKCAEGKGVVVHSYSRNQISNSMNGARTREEIAAAVADSLSVLRPRLPKPRPIWIGEQSAMRLFCAAACALAYFDLEAI